MLIRSPRAVSFRALNGVGLAIRHRRWRQDPEKPENSSTGPSLGDAAKHAVAVLALLSLFLTMAGYGYEWALLDRFGVRPEQMSLTPSDYLLRAYKPVLSLFGRYAQDPTGAIGDLFMDSFGYVLRLYFPLTILLVAAIYFSGHTRTAARLAAWTRSVAERIAQTPQRTRFRLLGWSTPVVTAASLLIALAASTLLIFFVTGLMLLLIVIVPGSTIELAREYAQMYIIDPAHCRTVDARKGVREGVTCYRVVVHGEELVRGRLVEQTNNRLLLYRKSHGVVLAPLDDGAVVEEVDFE